MNKHHELIATLDSEYGVEGLHKCVNCDNVLQVFRPAQ
jgi:hypothetical protein